MGKFSGGLEVGWEKVVCWSTKAAISLKALRQGKSYYEWLIETYQRSFERFERYHPRPPTASYSPRLGVCDSHPKIQSLLGILSVSILSTQQIYVT